MSGLRLYQKAMQSRLVLTLIGRDRPGLVDALAATVADHGGNWVESRMCRLGGEFAGVLRVEIPEEAVGGLSAALGKLESQGLQVTSRPDSAIDEETSSSATIEIVGQDRPGIVKEISHALAMNGVNVEELHTERNSAPMSGEMMFEARIDVTMPGETDTAALSASLEKIAADLMVEIKFEEGK